VLSTHRTPGQPSLGGAEDAGRVLAMFTWVIFGWGVVPLMLERMTWSVLLYSVLSLTIIRMAPVYLCLAGTAIQPASRLFIGWFGPRGLASIVFAIMVLNEQLPGNETVMAAIGVTVMLSVILHGITATPLAAWIGSRPQQA
jgi:sodium/hydrogen antiporter